MAILQIEEHDADHMPIRSPWWQVTGFNMGREHGAAGRPAAPVTLSGTDQP